MFLHFSYPLNAGNEVRPKNRIRPTLRTHLVFVFKIDNLLHWGKKIYHFWCLLPNGPTLLIEFSKLINV